MKVYFGLPVQVEGVSLHMTLTYLGQAPTINLEEARRIAAETAPIEMDFPHMETFGWKNKTMAAIPWEDEPFLRLFRKLARHYLPKQSGNGFRPHVTNCPAPSRLVFDSLALMSKKDVLESFPLKGESEAGQLTLF